MILFLFVLIASIVGIFILRNDRSWAKIIKKSLLLSAVSTFIFQGANAYMLGYLDPFAIIAACIQFVLSMVICALVGIVLTRQSKVRLSASEAAAGRT